jgi:membrane protease YdiL (CAAX protease family)
MGPRAYLLVAVAAEVAYLIGRVLIRSEVDGPISAELAVTAWRLIFAIAYGWMFFVALGRKAVEGRIVPHRPVLIGVILLTLLAGPPSWGEPDVDWSLRIALILTAPVVALREELFYRGILLRGLEAEFHPLVAMVVTGVAFVLSHLGAQPMNAYTIAAMAALGILVGAIYQLTRNLWFVVLLHTLYDCMVAIPQIVQVPPFTIFAGNVLVIAVSILWWFSGREGGRIKS